MKLIPLTWSLTALLAVSPIALLAQEAEAPPAADSAEAATDAFLAGLKRVNGAVDLPGGKAHLTLPDSLYYLDPADSRKLIVEGWGNPPGSAQGVLGMIVPHRISPLDAQGWGVVITYTDDGHVSDEDADQINYSDLLKEMQEGTAAENEQRAKSGFEPIHLVDWAEPPSYDKANHKMYWAKDLKFGNGDDPHTLNYAIRVLGREGVLELNAVASLDQLESIRRDMSQIVGITEFTAGNRYADFNSSTDRLATYGVLGLIAGAVAAKKGLLAVIGIFLLKFWKIAAIAVVAFGGAISKLFGRDKKTIG